MNPKWDCGMHDLGALEDAQKALAGAEEERDRAKEELNISSTMLQAAEAAKQAILFTRMFQSAKAKLSRRGLTKYW